MKSAVIIGGASGVGRALATDLDARGYAVGVTGRHVELLDEVVETSDGPWRRTRSASPLWPMMPG